MSTDIVGQWRTSSHSGAQGGNCVEVAPLITEVRVRDSKLATSPILTAPAEAWTAFLAATR